jgi:hypothetical protein
MQAFRVHSSVKNDYQDYLKSFMTISDERIRVAVENAFELGTYLPEPLLQFNPSYQAGASVDELVREGTLHPELRSIECKRSTILKLTSSDYRKYWPSSVEGMAEGLRILRDECGVLTGNWLPYYTFLIPFAAVIAETKGRFQGPSAASWKDKLQRWFWASTLAQSFENAPNSAAKSQYSDLMAWIDRDVEPPFVAEALSALESVVLLDVTPRQRARYRGFMCAVLHRGVRDFYKAEPISADKIRKGEVNDHHIFPKAVFGIGEMAEVIDSIPNRTLIDEQSNKIIRDKKPSVYVPQLRKVCRAEFFDDIFSEHMIPTQNGDSISGDDLPSFLAARSKDLKEEMKLLIGFPPNDEIRSLASV